jgi:predicted Rossmann fold flavoprotein
VKNVERVDAFHLDTTAGDVQCQSLVIATGGLSFPKVGATDFGYRIAEQFGLEIEPTRPALVPLVFETPQQTSKLAGISVDSIVSTAGQSFRENILFTHRGLSGPAVLQISNYWKKDVAVAIDLLPGTDANDFIRQNRQSTQTLANVLSRLVPERLAQFLAPQNLAGKPFNQVTQKDLEATAAVLNGWNVRFRDTEGYDRAEVTVGGVSTDELSSQTMESKKLTGLFFIGEVVDVTGWLGGYNFQWAWASGYAAGQAV